MLESAFSWELKNQLTRPDLFSMLTDTSKGGIIVIKNKPELQSGFEKMADIFSYGGNIYSELSAALDIVSEFFDVCRPQNEKTAKRSGKIISEKVRTYIEQNYADSIKIEDIAANTGFCSRSDMSRKIREYYGVTPSEIRFG